ncbi:SDR family NAD(P)-dependent oxidoreductase [Neogemmobacter tilapiae]|uniref:3-oxoacyl-ACP reductase n=1 Tax=Neogemmobacter tilapiae TaxID=875041 RepID=A0A918WN01_9RHOB|nr:SDR family oxidoreductase [Gemmobacter tilapiae]GHC60176.1 3-oxoacyl-ACP reductase [Gemmobacter tilapiae]
MTLPRTPSFRLDGRRALVAGASSGIGAGAAVALAEQGAEVTLCARRRDDLQVLADEMNAAGMRAQILPLDITDLPAMEQALANRPAFDILVNSAGLARHSPATQTTPQDFDLAADLNFRAAYFLTRTIAARLISEGRPGSLINITSQMAHVGGIDRAVYAATKHAVEGMTKSMAIEWGPHGIRVNTIAPTFIRTALTADTFANPERAAWIASKIKLGRVGEVSDIMGPVAFLASDAAALITGTSLIVDGGWTAD